MITSASPSIPAKRSDRSLIGMLSPMANPTAPPPTSCGIVTNTGNPARAPAPSIVRSSAPMPAIDSKLSPCSLARRSTTAAIRSMCRPIGYPKLPAALMTDLPGAWRSRSMSPSSSAISSRSLIKVGPVNSVNSNASPCGSNASSTPTLRPSTRLTRSSTPAISCAMTAELVVTPSTIPARINSATSVVTPS